MHRLIRAYWHRICEKVAISENCSRNASSGNPRGYWVVAGIARIAGGKTRTMWRPRGDADKWALPGTHLDGKTGRLVPRPPQDRDPEPLCAYRAGARYGKSYGFPFFRVAQGGRCAAGVPPISASPSPGRAVVVALPTACHDMGAAAFVLASIEGRASSLSRRAVVDCLAELSTPPPGSGNWPLHLAPALHLAGGGRRPGVGGVGPGGWGSAEILSTGWSGGDDGAGAKTGKRVHPPPGGEGNGSCHVQCRSVNADRFQASFLPGARACRGR